MEPSAVQGGDFQGLWEPTLLNFIFDFVVVFKIGWRFVDTSEEFILIDVVSRCKISGNDL